jgi:hypothetical protein
MYRVRVAVASALIMAGCGRLGFDPGEIANDASHDANHDDAQSELAAEDAASDDAVVDACAGRAGAIFCDGFEASTLDAWFAATGNPTLQTTLVHGGSGAMLATSDDSHQPANVRTQFSPLPSGSIHARGWFYFPSGYALEKFEVLSLNGTNDNVTVLVDQGELRVFSAASPGTTITTGTSTPRDRWICLEVHVGISGTAGSVTLDLDGMSIGTETGINTLPGGGYGELVTGLNFVFATQPPATLYVDDVVVGTQPIGCS